MSYLRFDRYRLFDTDIMKAFGEAKTILEADMFKKKNPSFNVMNMLAGVYDGYLYPDLLQSVEDLKLDREGIDRLKVIIELILEDIEKNGETTPEFI